ncbi:MAG: dockerin type I repeat-containing protein [Planctomycetota bacterium]
MRSSFLLGCLFAMVVTTAATAVEDPSHYQLRLIGDSAPAGSNVEVRILLDNAAGLPVSGWSYGVCHDTSHLTLQGITDGATTAVIRGGAAPSFNSVHDNPAGGSGWTIGVVVDFFGIHTLLPGYSHELNRASYELSGVEGDTTTVYFCNTLGEPPVDVQVVAGGAPLVPFYFDGEVTVDSQEPIFRFTAPSLTVAYNPEDGNATVEALIEVAERSDHPGYPNVTQGFSMNLKSDPAVLTPTGIGVTGDIMILNEGSGPAFVLPNLLPSQATVGVIYAMLDPVLFVFETPKQVVRVEYEANPALLLGDADGHFTRLTWTPPYSNEGGPANVVIVGGESRVPTLEEGEIDFVPVLVPDFRRGDCNGDSIINFADAIWLLNQIATPGAPQGTCSAACDANTDGSVNLADCVYLFMFRFLGGLPPSHPYPDCGKAVSGLECESYRSCP